MQSSAPKDIDLGHELGPIRLTLHSEQVRRYAQVANMPGGRFFSDEDAKREGLPGQIVPGNLSLALFSRLIGEALPGGTVEKLGATFRALVRPGTPLVVRGVVTERVVGQGGGLVECDLVLESEDGDRLVTGSATVNLARLLDSPA